MDLLYYSREYANVDLWVRHNWTALSRFDSGECGNDAIRFDKMLSKMADAVRVGDVAAISLAISFLAADPKAPFGKIVKSRILRALRSHPSLIAAEHWRLLRNIHERWASLGPFPPREMRYLAKLLELGPGS